jgi:hypothetical protein
MTDNQDAAAPPPAPQTPPPPAQEQQPQPVVDVEPAPRSTSPTRSPWLRPGKPKLTLLRVR